MRAAKSGGLRGGLAGQKKHHERTFLAISGAGTALVAKRKRKGSLRLWLSAFHGPTADDSFSGRVISDFYPFHGPVIAKEQRLYGAPLPTRFMERPSAVFISTGV